MVGSHLKIRRDRRDKRRSEEISDKEGLKVNS